MSSSLPSPSILLQGRRLRGNFPIVAVAKRFPKGDNRKLVKENSDNRANNAKMYHDRKAGNAKPVLKPGDDVRARIQVSWTPATIVGLGDKYRSYVIRTKNGTEMRRNNLDLRLSREETVSSQLVSQRSDVTDTVSRELTVTVDVTRGPAT